MVALWAHICLSVQTNYDLLILFYEFEIFKKQYFNAFSQVKCFPPTRKFFNA